MLVLTAVALAVWDRLHHRLSLPMILVAVLRMALSKALKASLSLYGAHDVQQVTTRGLQEVPAIMESRMMRQGGQQAFNK